jgi:hypothetical protein
MKILWLGQQDTHLSWLNDLRREMSCLCGVVAYGDGPEFIPEFNVKKIVRKESPDVIMIGNNQYKFTNIDKVNIPKALKCTDNWANLLSHVKFIKDNNVELILMNYNCARFEYMKYLPDRKFGRLPHTLNPANFCNQNLERSIDVLFDASDNFGVYPVRASIYHGLKDSTEFKVYAKEPHTLSFEEYVKKINEAKIFAYGNVNLSVGKSRIMIFPMAKAFEIMGCETLCMMDIPDEAEELYFIPEWNFVPITRNNFKGKIWYYLEHEQERKRIARRGLDTCLQYHTVKVRTRELKTQLEEIMRK